MKISVVIPTWNRTSLLYEAIGYPAIDERVSEIVVYDDHSNVDIYNQVVVFCERHEKIKLFRGAKNMDCYRAKREAISKASNEYVIILDSDNQIDEKYIDTIYANTWSPERILQPSFAKPHFDFRKFNSLLANRKNVAKYANDSTFTTALNAMNFFVNRDRYLEVWDSSVDPVTSDSIYFNYKWLEAGNSIYVTPGLEYEHRIHDGSHYQQNNKRTPNGFHESILKKLKALR
jgi:glycosyltransferase involved in cell wall biosynthesis